MRALVVFLVLVFVGAALAVEITHLRPSGFLARKRGLVTLTAVDAAASNLSWVVRVPCLLEWDAVDRFINTLNNAAAVNEATDGSLGVPCGLTFVAQAMFNTTFVVQCTVATDDTLGAKIKALVRSSSAALPAECVSDVLTTRDIVFHTTTGTTQTISNAGLYNLDALDQRTRPLNSHYTYYLDGTGVTIYVIDTSCKVTHTQFGGRAQVILNVIGGTDDDCHGHGTHCAGTAAGITYGVAKNASIACIKALDCTGSGTMSGLIVSLDEVSDRQTASPHLAVVSMSVAGGTDSATNSAVNALIVDKNVPVVVAAGNAAGNACSYSPASASQALTCASTGTTDVLSSFSNYGSCVDIAGPGENILSAGIASNTATAVMSGTSMITPHAAGVMALEMEWRQSQGLDMDGPATIAAVKAMATANKVNTPSGKLPLIYSNLGAPIPSPAPPVPSPSGKAAPKTKPAAPRQPIGRQSDATRVVYEGLFWVALVVTIVTVLL